MSHYSAMPAGAGPAAPPRGSRRGQRGRMLFVAGQCFARPAEYVMRSAVLSSLIMLPLAAAHSQTIVVNALTATPTVVQPGQTVVLSATMTASANASNYPVEFSVPGQNAVVPTSFTAGKPITRQYSWTVPTSTTTGAKTFWLGVYNSQWAVPALAYASTSFSVSAAGATTAAAPANSQPPVISGTAQVGKVLTSSTGTWTGATSYAYKWAGNGAIIAGATASTYTPVASDVGHTLAATVTATGANGAASATSAPTAAIVADPSAAASGAAVTAGPQKPGPSAQLFNSPYYRCVHNYYVSTTGSDTTGDGSPALPWKTLQKANNSLPAAGAAAGYCVNVAPGTYAQGVNVTKGGNLASSTGYVVYRCQTMDACKVTDYGAAGCCAFGFSGTQIASYVMIDGFTLASAATTGNGQGVGAPIGNPDGVYKAFSHHIWVLNSIISGYQQSGIQLNLGEYFFVVHNTIHGNSNQSCYQGSGFSSVWEAAVPGYKRTADNSSNSILGNIGSFNNAVEWNVFYNNSITANCGGNTDGNNIIFDTNNGNNYPSGPPAYPGTSLVAFNVTYNSGGNGIWIFLTGGVTVANNNCYNSSLDPQNNGSARPCIGDQVTGQAANTFINNISYQIAVPGGKLAYNNAFQINQSNDIATNNISYCVNQSVCNGAYYRAVFSASSNKTNTLPKWVNVGTTSTGSMTTPAGGANFALQSDSPAIGYGLTKSYLPAQSVDAGACSSTLATCP